MVYRAILDIAWNARTRLYEKEDHRLREAVLLQRSRTPRHAQLHASAIDQMLLHTYCEYLQTLPATPDRQVIINTIQCGNAKIKNSQFASLMLSLRMAPRAVAAISDLSLLILRNRTAVPFVVGDAPCAFSNHYMRSIRGNGVLGFLTPGLMIALPLDSRTQVLLYDLAVYSPDYVTGSCVDVFSIADVSMLNALQIHSAEENVYFSDASSEMYVRELLDAHRGILQDLRGRFIVHAPGEVLVDGAPSTSEILHFFEPQLPITLDLTFMSTASLPADELPNRPRDPSLAWNVEQALGVPSQASPVQMDDFSAWMEPLISISETSH